jgi:hypothetical protein
MTPAIWMAGCATASLIVSIGTIFYTWYASRQRATQRELEVLREKVLEIDAKRAADKGEMRDRIVRVEAEVENLPNHSQMAALTDNIQQVRGDVGGVRDMLNMLAMRIERVDNYLMNEKGSRG